MNSSAFARSLQKMVGSLPSNFPFPWGVVAGWAAAGWAGPPPPPLPPPPPPPPPPLPPPVGPGAEPDGGGPEREVRAVVIVDCVGVSVTTDILFGLSGMLASLSCTDSDWWVSGSGSSSGASCTCSTKRSSSSSMGRMTSCRSKSPLNGLRSGLSRNIVGVSHVAVPPSHSWVIGFRSF